MAYILTNEQMREADEYTIHCLGVDGFSLMEKAGLALAHTARKLAPTGEIAIVCGGGNNGGDGLVCARFLRAWGREICLVLLEDRRSEYAQKAKTLYETEGGEIFTACDEKKKVGLVVDCMFGTGFHGEFDGVFLRAAKAIENWKKQGAKVLSADIPSGVNGNNGFACKHAVCATHTLCIGERKAGVYLHDGIDHSGEILREDIGIVLPRATYAKLLEKEYVKSLLPLRNRNVHKGTFGCAAIVAGSEKYTGAAALALSACLRSGAGYTTLFTPKKVLDFFVLKYPEALLESLNEGGRVAFNEEIFQKMLAYDSIAYGMGMENSKDVALGAKWLLLNYQGKLILDADGINSLAKFEGENLAEIFKNKKCEVVITPHLKEFSRLSKEEISDILKGGFSSPFAFANAHKICVLLKNAVTIITNGQEIFLNVKGTSGQAKGGSGDVLAGVIAGLCASGLSVFEGAQAAAFLVGEAAEIAVKKTGEYSLLASDVVQAFLSVTQDF